MDKKISVGIICSLQTNNNEYLRTSGSGFLINENGDIITCYHVIQNSKSIFVIYNSKIYSNITVKEYSEKYDLALLKINNFKENLFEIRLKETIEDIEVNYMLKIIGNPRGLPNHTLTATLTKNTFVNSGLYKENGIPLFREEIDLISLESTIYSGLSGSPVIYNNEVIGVISGSISEGGTLAWAIPIKYLKNLKYINKRAGEILWPKLNLMNNSWSNTRINFSLNSIYEDHLKLYIELNEKYLLIFRKLREENNIALNSLNKTKIHMQNYIDKPVSFLRDSFFLSSIETAKNIRYLGEYFTKYHEIYDTLSSTIVSFNRFISSQIRLYYNDTLKLDRLTNEQLSFYKNMIDNSELANSKLLAFNSNLREYSKTQEVANSYLAKANNCMESIGASENWNEEEVLCIKMYYEKAIEKINTNCILLDSDDFYKSMQLFVNTITNMFEAGFYSQMFN